MDLIERLRDAAALPNGLYAEAADEIERLRADLAALKQQEPVAIVDRAVAFYDKEYATFMVKIENCWDNPIAKGSKLYLAPQPAQVPEDAMTAMVDAAMVEMKNIDPPLRRSECLRLINAAMLAAQQPAQVPKGPPAISAVYEQKVLDLLPYLLEKYGLAQGEHFLENMHNVFLEFGCELIEQYNKAMLAAAPQQEGK